MPKPLGGNPGSESKGAPRKKTLKNSRVLRIIGSAGLEATGDGKWLRVVRAEDGVDPAQHMADQSHRHRLEIGRATSCCRECGYCRRDSGSETVYAISTRIPAEKIWKEAGFVESTRAITSRQKRRGSSNRINSRTRLGELKLVGCGYHLFGDRRAAVAAVAA